MSNQSVVKKAIARKQKRIMTALVKRATRNFGKERFSKFLNNSTVTSGVNTNGSTGYSQIEGRWLGLQNRGYTPQKGDRVTAKKASALRFTVGGRGTLIPNNLDSQRPIQGNTVVFRKSVRKGAIKAGRWDLANKKDVLENLDVIVKES